MITLQEVQDALDSYAKINEFLYVLHDRKPVLRILLSPQQRDKVVALFKRADLHYSFARMRIRVQQDPKLGYSNKGAVSSDEGAFIMYAGKRSELVHKAQEAEQDGDHVLLGRILGYPPCCCRFFSTHFPEQSEKDNDYVLPMIQASDHDNLVEARYPWKNNVFVRYGDFALLSHFPCHLGCSESQQLAETYWQVIQHFRPKYAEMTENMLKWAVLYMPYSGVFFLRGAVRSGTAVSFSHVTATARSSMFTHLDTHKKLALLGPDSVQMGQACETPYLLVFS